MTTFAAGAYKGSGRRYWIDSPSGNAAGRVDSQTIKTATQGATIGYDAGKKIKGRKRHLLVDTLGLIRQVEVAAAEVGDRDGLKRVVTRYVAPGVRGDIVKCCGSGPSVS